MADFMPICQRKIYNVRRDIEVNSCKQLLRFESVVFLANEFLVTDNCNGRLSKQQEIEILLQRQTRLFITCERFFNT